MGVDQALPSPSYGLGNYWAAHLTSEASHLMHNASLPQAGEVVDQALPSPSYGLGNYWAAHLTSKASHLMHNASLPQADEVVDQNMQTSVDGIRFFANRDDLVSFFNPFVGSDKMALVIDAPSIHN